jgi:hypothetical protein
MEYSCRVVHHDRSLANETLIWMMHEGRKAGAPFDIPNWANDWLTSQSYDGKGFTNNAVRHQEKKNK